MISGVVLTTVDISASTPPNNIENNLKSEEKNI